MAAMVEASIDCIATDPPYELGFMGRSWDKSGIANDAAMWREAFRVLKPGGILVAFSHARTYHRMVCAIEDAGFEIRDQIMWLYGSGFPKGGNRDGKGSCLKPAHEPIVVARKPLIGSVAANEAMYGTGAINIDACRIHSDDALGGTYTVKRLKPGATLDKTGGNWRPTDGVEYHGEMKPGRWPANIVHDGSDEVLAGFPAHAGGAAPASGSTRTDGFKSRAMAGSMNGISTPAPFYGDTGSAARFFYCAKASKSDRDEGLDHLDPQAFVQFQTGNGESGAASSLSEGRETQYRNIHPTVKPEGLMRWLVRLYTPPGGTVLDPFTGSGSTGKAAVLEGLDFIGCELTDEYIPIARARIAAAELRVADVPPPSPQLGLFEDAA
ncbi:site-specific DNA-methyltransferase [Sphingomonas sp. CARO-RG-8B-R24-01]|uniref:DNA-methyltransferase n=1 Tax=Sphingomonas sp. CARO-RG-8B-R24-01 TaxID=2914831 RepID=UPI001F594B5B|nr:site-specific DNA-methyltransferase [Sphingomonas sp. CARO-RG-8B-R24-01]